MKLEVGMYVRTKRGQIGKIVHITEFNVAVEFNGMWQYVINKENIVKASYSLVGKQENDGVLEVGDYVNGSKVIEINEYNGEKYVYVEETEYSNANQTDINVYYRNEYIETIVTKEQMEAMAYKVV